MFAEFGLRWQPRRHSGDTALGCHQRLVQMQIGIRTPGIDTNEQYIRLTCRADNRWELEIAAVGRNGKTKHFGTARTGIRVVQKLADVWHRHKNSRKVRPANFIQGAVTDR